MADEANKSFDATELSADDLQQVTGGSASISTPKQKVIEKSPIVTESNKTILVGYDITENTSS
jgi:bacteriocin-like protein